MDKDSSIAMGKVVRVETTKRYAEPVVCSTYGVFDCVVKVQAGVAQDTLAGVAYLTRNGRRGNVELHLASKLAP
jgi:hypothetical protein